MKPPVWTLTPERFAAALGYLRGLARGDLARFDAAMPPTLAEPHADAVQLLDSLAMQAGPPPPEPTAAPAAKVIPLRRCTDRVKPAPALPEEPGPVARRVSELLLDDDEEEGGST